MTFALRSTYRTSTTFRFFEALKYPAIQELIKVWRSGSVASSCLQVISDDSFVTWAVAGGVVVAMSAIMQATNASFMIVSEKCCSLLAGCRAFKTGHDGLRGV